MELKERIAKLRRIKNLTQAELAEKVGNYSFHSEL